jgi:hypothetical protein
MSTILAIEPDRRRAAQLTSMARAHLRAELLVAPTAAQAVEALDGRVPDVLLTAPLLPSHEETVIADYLRQLGAAAAHVQTLTIPLLAGPDGDHDRPVLSAFRRGRGRVQRTEAEGCDPAVFAEQITEYLREARERRVVPTLVDVPAPPSVEAPAPAALPVPRTLIKKETISELLARLFPGNAQDDENSSPEVAETLVSAFDAAVPGEPSMPVSYMAEAAAATYELQPTAVVDLVESRQEQPSSAASPATNGRQFVAMPVDAAPAVDVAVAVSVNVGPHVVTAPPLKRGRTAQPVQDEWGFFDPNQCGFPALVAKLDEIAARDSDR